MNSEALPQENHEANEDLKPKFSTRTVLFDQDGKVAIINVEKHGYYKIPGGGIEEHEEIQDAAKREVLEETGCNCSIISELDRVETAVPVWGMLDISDGYVAVVSGEKAQPDYEEWEQERGFKLEWFDDLDTAIATIECNEVREPGMDALQARDLFFLKRAREKLETDEINI